jgi:hypothetical protein
LAFVGKKVSLCCRHLLPTNSSSASFAFAIEGESKGGREADGNNCVGESEADVPLSDTAEKVVGKVKRRVERRAIGGQVGKRVDFAFNYDFIRSDSTSK